jgi:hypothetical protein
MVSFRLLPRSARNRYAVLSSSPPKGATKNMRYHIRVKGHLDQSWQAWFEGVEIVLEADGTSLLAGFLRDQAALYGILLRIRTLGLTLLSHSSEEGPEHEKWRSVSSDLPVEAHEAESKE